jgi:NADPH2:quinone reductase
MNPKISPEHNFKPIVAKTFPLASAADALRYLVEARPFGSVVLTI